MHNLYANFVKILDVCKKFSANLVNELGKMPRPDVVPKFSDLFNIMRNYAKQHIGFFTRIISMVSAFTVPQYLNTINNRPIGRIKYALA